MYKGVINESRTYDAAAIVAAIGILEANSHIIQQYAGEYFGLFLLALSVWKAYLRKKTTGPVGQK